MCVGSVPVSRTFTASDRRGPGTAWTCDTGVTCRVEREFSRLPRMTRQLRLEILMRGCLSGVIPRAGRHWPGSGGRGIGGLAPRLRQPEPRSAAAPRGPALLLEEELEHARRGQRICQRGGLFVRPPSRRLPSRRGRGARVVKGDVGRRPSARGGRHRGDWAGVAVVDNGAAVAGCGVLAELGGAVQATSVGVTAERGVVSSGGVGGCGDPEACWGDLVLPVRAASAGHWTRDARRVASPLCPALPSRPTTSGRTLIVGFRRMIFLHNCHVRPASLGIARKARRIG